VSLPKFVLQSANLPLSDQSCPFNVPAGSADNSAGISADEEEALSSADSGKFPAVVSSLQGGGNQHIIW
jgi:hypothetical protein